MFRNARTAPRVKQERRWQTESLTAGPLYKDLEKRFTVLLHDTTTGTNSQLLQRQSQNELVPGKKRKPFHNTDEEPQSKADTSRKIKYQNRHATYRYLIAAKQHAIVHLKNLKYIINRDPRP